MRALTVGNPHIRGLVITALGVLIITPDSLLVRLIGTDAWTILFFRGAFLALSLALFIIVRFGRETLNVTLAIGRVGILSGFLAAGSNTLFVISITLTTVANTLVIVSAAPLFAAIYSRLFLKETIAAQTWVAVLIVFLGIASIFSGSFASGVLLGDICAIGAALFFAGHLTALRHAKSVNMVPAVALSGLITMLVVLPLAAPFSISVNDLILLAVMGFFMLPIALGLITYGPRLIPAPEAGLLILLESILGPFWVWLVIEEVPAIQTFFGGVVILGTLAVHTAYMLRIEMNRTS